MAFTKEPFYRSLYKPPLFMGCDRTLMRGVSLAVFMMLSIELSLMTVFYAAFFWFAAFLVLKRWGTKDPYMWRAYKECFRHRNWYQASGTVIASGRTPRKAGRKLAA